MNNTIMFKEIIEQPERIKNCHDYNKEKISEIRSVIEKFKPQNIVIVGRGTSLHAGIYARYLLELYYHIPVSIASQSVFTVYDSYTDMSKSIVIGISQSGFGKDTLRTLEKARNSGALTISIVNNLNSEIAKATEYVLYCNAGECQAVPATKSFTTTLYLINSLVYALTKRKEIELNEDDIINAIEAGLKYHNLIKEKANKLRDFDDLFILGRGLSLPLAMETALKIKETSRIHVSSYPISEFYHGPLAMIKKTIPVIIFGIEKEFTNDVEDILKRLKANDVPTLLISNNKDLINQHDNSIYIEDSNKLKTLFTATVIIQLLACELALLKGYNPDKNEQLLNIKTF